MNTFRPSFFNLLFACLVLFSIGCRKEEIIITEPTQQAVSLLDIAKKDSRLSLFVQAAQRVQINRLERNDVITVLAPTNDAFQQYMQENGFARIEDIPTATLRTLILNHMIAGDFAPSAFPVGYVPTMAEVKTASGSEAVHMFVERRDQSVYLNGVKVNDNPTWTETGILYTTPKMIETADAKTHILSNPKFSAFAAALSRKDLDRDYLTLFGQVQDATVLIPSNGAFASFMIEQRVSSLDKIPAATMSAVLSYHLSANLLLHNRELAAGQAMPTLQGKQIAVSFDGKTITLTDVRGRKAQVEDTDIRATNAILHSTNRILLPL